MFADESIRSTDARLGEMMEGTHSTVWLSRDARVEPDYFGWKAANLCSWDPILTRTPKGFAISRALVTRLANDNVTDSELDELKSMWMALEATKPGNPVIVRSSSSIEHARTNSFAGLFATVRDVCSFDELVVAISTCNASSNTPQVLRYAALRGTSIPDEHMAVVVQQQVQVIYSALLHIAQNGFLFEVFEGDLSLHIHGRDLPGDVVKFDNGLTTVLRASNRIPRSFFDGLRDVAHDVQQAIADGVDVDEYLLEAASEGDGVIVLQLSQIGPCDGLSLKGPSLNLDVRNTVLEDSAEYLGIKAAAMNYFFESGLFSYPLWVFPPGTPVNDIRASLPEDTSSQGYTVRYSHTGDLGLPRSFRPDRDAVVAWIQESREAPWTTIVHSYINVEHSFEILLTGDSVLLEHVTGMWESENSTDPDVIVIRDQQVRAWIATSVKNAVFAAPEGSSERPTVPTSLSQIKRWAERIDSVGHLLKHDLAASMPLNVHFVEDSQQRWFFLNIRRGFGLEDVTVANGEPHIVRDVSDLEFWDRLSPILIRFTAERGEENRVIEIGENLLHYRDVPILIDFGLLSHPAVILRELGFTLVPTYLHSGNRLLSPSYQTHEWPLDRDDEPIIRIRNEPPVYIDKWVRVVLDRDPIVPGHLLVVAEENVKSFADSGAVSSLVKLHRCLGSSEPSGPWIFVERGRALFCTSGFTKIHAHGHLLPEECFNESAVDAFAKEIGAKRYDSLSAAYIAVRLLKGEYVLAATSYGPTYVSALPPGRSFERRQVRNFFTGWIK